MKKYLLLISMLLVMGATFAQTAKKPPVKEKPPTQKEMEEMMKEAQKGMDNMDPETKRMMDSMGIKMPSLENVPKVNDKQLAVAWEIENLIVPKKDDERIASISKTALTAGSLGSFMSSVNNKTIAMLRPESKTLAEKIYGQLKSTGKNSDAIGNTASGLWIMGRLQPALYIMGCVCSDDPTNTDNLSNYAAMLSMSGVQQSAIPLLDYLNTKYSGNSTILNNLGQAWFGLGDMIKAEKYLDSAIRIYAWHPQANLTKSFIEESKGNKTEAVNLVKKAILHSYSEEKEERLRKLGHKLTSKEVSLPKNPKADPLNLGGFGPPPFPKSVDECIAMEPVWKNFRQQLNSQAAVLGKQLTEAMKIAFEMQEKRTNANLAMIKASINDGSPQGMLTLVPIHTRVAGLKQQEVTDEYNRKVGALMKKVSDYLTQSGIPLEQQYDKEMIQLQEEDLDQTGEGMPNKDFCPKYKEAADKFLRAHNGAMEPFFKDFLVIHKTYLNEVTHWQMYSEWPERFEASKMVAKVSWLGALTAESTPFITTFISITNLRCANPPQAKAGKLSHFDDVACKYHSEISLPLGKMKMDCSRFTTELDLSFIKFGLKQDMDKETFADQFMGGSVEVGAKIGTEKKLGPLSIGASAGGRIGVEIGRNGVTDVYVIGGVKSEAGTNIISEASEATGTPSSMAGQGISDLSIGGGIEGRISLISGRVQFNGTGIFEN